MPNFKWTIINGTSNVPKMHSAPGIAHHRESSAVMREKWSYEEEEHVYCRVTASDHMDDNGLFNPPSVDESLKDSDLKDSDLKVMRLIDEMTSELRSKKTSSIDETMISELSTQLYRRLDGIDVSDSPTMRK